MVPGIPTYKTVTPRGGRGFRGCGLPERFFDGQQSVAVRLLWLRQDPYPRAILSMYPRPSIITTTTSPAGTYLKVDCPIDGDSRTLPGAFKPVDRVLGTHYSRSHGRKKLGTKRLLASMCQIANLHALGVLIIDEVQNLNEARSGRG